MSGKRTEEKQMCNFKITFQNKGMNGYLNLVLAVKKILGPGGRSCWPGGPPVLYNYRANVKLFLLCLI